MILLYCDDVMVRSACQHYFRDRGIVIEGAGAGEIVELSIIQKADALLIIGYCHPAIAAMIRYDIPIITVGVNSVENAQNFDDYKSPKLLSLLLHLSDDISKYNFCDLIRSNGNETLYIGYRLDLTPTEKAVLAYFVNNSDRSISNEELLKYAIGDKYRKKTNVTQHISNINKKARIIGSRTFISTDKDGAHHLYYYM